MEGRGAPRESMSCGACSTSRSELMKPVSSSVEVVGSSPSKFDNFLSTCDPAPVAWAWNRMPNSCHKKSKVWVDSQEAAQRRGTRGLLEGNPDLYQEE
jgi:hypothetical protein